MYERSDGASATMVLVKGSVAHILPYAQLNSVLLDGSTWQSPRLHVSPQTPRASSSSTNTPNRRRDRTSRSNLLPTPCSLKRHGAFRSSAATSTPFRSNELNKYLLRRIYAKKSCKLSSTSSAL